MATIFDRDYRLRARDLATALVLAERLNPILRSIDLRIGGVEDRSASIAEMEAELRDYGTARIDALLTPIVAAIDAAAGLGALLTTTSGTALEVGEGVKELVIPQPEALVFAPTATLSIVAVDDPTATMLARRAAWNAATGHLVVEVIAFTGAGIHTSWILSAAAVADNAAQVRTPAQGGLVGATLVQQLGEIDAALTLRQPLAETLSAFADLDLVGDRALVTDANGAPDLATLTTIGRALLAAADKAAARSAIDAAPIASAQLTGEPTAPTAPVTADSNRIANITAVRAAVADLVSSSPAALDTLAELAAALGNDGNFAASITTALATKQPLVPALTPLRPIGDLSILQTALDYTRASGASGGSGTFYQASDTFEIAPARLDAGLYITANIRHQLLADLAGQTNIQATFGLQYWDGAQWTLFGQGASIGLSNVPWSGAGGSLRTSAVCDGRLGLDACINGKFKVRVGMAVTSNNTTLLVFDSQILALEYGAKLT